MGAHPLPLLLYVVVDWILWFAWHAFRGVECGQHSIFAGGHRYHLVVKV